MKNNLVSIIAMIVVVLFLFNACQGLGGGDGERCVERVFVEGSWYCIPANDWANPIACENVSLDSPI